MTVVICLMCCFVIALPARSQTEHSGSEGATKSKERTLLRGSISLSDRVPALADELQEGRIVDLEKLKALTPKNVWYKIPSWSAGGWKQSRTTRFHVKYLRTGSIDNSTSIRNYRMASSLGCQVDRNGDIWDCAGATGLNVGETDDHWSVFLIRDVTPGWIDQKECELKLLADVLTIRKSDQRVIESHRQESINRTTQAGEKLNKTISSNRVFDKFGVPIYEFKSLSYETQSRPFTVVNSYQGRNLRALFTEYLKAHGLAQIAPL